jgi:hypothetical protein
MLYPANDYLLHVIKEETARQFRLEVEIDRLAEEMNPEMPSWSTSQARNALHNLGHTLWQLGSAWNALKLMPPNAADSRIDVTMGDATNAHPDCGQSTQSAFRPPGGVGTSTRRENN